MANAASSNRWPRRRPNPRPTPRSGLKTRGRWPSRRREGERLLIEQRAGAQADAEAIASLGLEDKGAVIVTASEGWHPGVVGLVASRLKEKFSRPVFAIALEPGGIGTGSGRSIGGVDLGKAVRLAVTEGLLMKGGGHAMAARATLPEETPPGSCAQRESA